MEDITIGMKGIFLSVLRPFALDDEQVLIFSTLPSGSRTRPMGMPTTVVAKQIICMSVRGRTSMRPF